MTNQAQQLILKDSDCLISISEKVGHHWETIWNHPENSQLRSDGRDPLVLKKGDALTIPPLTEKTEIISSEKTHRFIRKGTPALVRIQVMHDNISLSNLPWSARIDNRVHTGRTDADGIIEIPIGNQAKSCHLEVGEDSDKVVYELHLGRLDPSSAVTGAQSRLNNLGFPAGKADGILGPNTRRALLEFQRAHGLEESGELDEATSAKLLEAHRS